MNIVTSFYKNISENKYVSSSLKNLKKNSIISNGLEIYSIAKDVYETVKNEKIEISKNPENSKNLEKTKIEDIYFSSTKKLTNLENEKIEKRLDYKIMKNLGQNSRKVVYLSKKAKIALQSRISELQNLASKSLKNLKTNFSVLSKYLKMNLEKLFEFSPLVFKDLLESLKIYSEKFMIFNTTILKKIQKTLKLSEILKSTQKKIKELTKILTTNLKSSYEAVIENKKSLKNVFLFSYQHLLLFFSQNYTQLQNLIEINGNLIKTFFKKFEFNIYYSKNECFRPIKSIRGLYEDIMTDRASCDNYDEVTSDDVEVENEVVEKTD